MKKSLLSVLFLAYIQTIKTIDETASLKNQAINHSFVDQNTSLESDKHTVNAVKTSSVNKKSNHEFKIIKKLACLATTLFTLFSIDKCWDTAQSIAKINSYLERHLLLNRLYKKIDWLISINCILASAFIVSIFDDFVQSL